MDSRVRGNDENGSVTFYEFVKLDEAAKKAQKHQKIKMLRSFLTLGTCFSLTT